MKKILVVEDEVIIAIDIKNTVEKLGFQTILAHNDVEALEAFKTKSPYAVIIDINLGKNSRSGIEIIKEIHKVKYIPVIYLSAYSDNITMQNLNSTAAAAFIVKPFKKKKA